ncbi:MAG: hypothetical protein AAGD07_10765 [Planctomycetota bacterium]
MRIENQAEYFDGSVEIGPRRDGMLRSAQTCFLFGRATQCPTIAFIE